MHGETDMNMKNLVKSWSLLDRSNERIQITLRIPFSDYARLRALKEIYPRRSVNDILSDIIKFGLDEIIEALPSRSANDDDVFEHNSYMSSDMPEDLSLSVGDSIGPAIDFECAYRRILESKSEEDSKEIAE